MITVSLWDESGNEETEVSFPSKKEVCPECNGEGSVLREGLRGYAFSAEEFCETFSEPEDQAEYFKRGGIYDETCPCCHGKNVIDVIDESALTAEQKADYELFQEQENERIADEACDRATRRAECGYC